jgi:Protein of unknown function DUF262/Protein of unknown function (DUF1524)
MRATLHGTTIGGRMSKAFDTEKFTIGSLLGRYERRRVVLPEFQRSYSWEKAHVTTFLDDLFLFEKEFAGSPSTASYFLGSIVLIERDDSVLLLDGQQRLASATIVLAAMRDLARSLDRPGSTMGADLGRDIQRELIEKDADPTTYALSLSELDEAYFLQAIKTDPPVIPATKLRSHGLIQAAYQRAYERLSEAVKAKAVDEQVRILKSLRDALSKGMTLIGIVVQNEEDAYTIFETLNDRGLRLSVPDLLLNLLMRRAPDDSARRLVRQNWNSMLTALGKRDVSRFLRHLWVSRYGDLKAEGLFAAIKRELEENKLDSVSFAIQCADECDDYVALLDVNVPMRSKGGLEDLTGIVKYLQIASAPPLLLSGYRCLDRSDFERLLHAIVSTHIRYVVATNQNPLDMETRLYEAARLIRASRATGSQSAAILTLAKAKLKELAVADAKVKHASAEIFLERAEGLWMMTQMANSMQSRTKEVGMDRANLEHVFPQNPKEADWPNASDLEPLTWHIGNLTILGEKLNQKAQNKSFADKSARHYSKSEIEMTKELLKFRSWTEADVLNRAKLLVKVLVAAWPAIQ